MTDEGWQQIKAGIALIAWSKLASWDARSLSLVPSTADVFERNAQKVHPEFGRLICWIAFSVGAEYLAKGACILNGLQPACKQDTVLLPAPSDDIENWISRVINHDPLLTESGLGFPMLGKLPVDKIPKSVRDKQFVKAGIAVLASSIRNRDAHRYTQNVRAFHFHLVESLFLPAFNILLASQDQDRLRTMS